MSSQNDKLAILDANISQNQLTVPKPQDGCEGVEYMEIADEVLELQVEMNKNPVSTAQARPRIGEPSGAQHESHQATQVHMPRIIDRLKVLLTKLRDNEKRDNIKKQLNMYVHVLNCHIRDMRIKMGSQYECEQSYCKYLKNVLNHRSTCEAGDYCTQPHCSSSRHIMDHWKNCKQKRCLVCRLSFERADPKACCMSWFLHFEAVGHISYEGPVLAKVREAYEDMDCVVPTTINSNGVVVMHTPTFAESNREWQKPLTIGYRTNLIIKALRQIYTTDAPPNMSHAKTQMVIERVKKIEYNIYTMAFSERHYFDQLQARASTLKKELDCSEQRLRQLQRQSHPTHQHDAAHDN